MASKEDTLLAIRFCLAVVLTGNKSVEWLQKALVVSPPINRSVVDRLPHLPGARRMDGTIALEKLKAGLIRFEVAELQNLIPVYSPNAAPHFI